MTQINPTQIANRTGRIVLTTILAGALVGVLSLFNPDRANDFTGPFDLVNLYLGAAFDVAIVGVLVGVIVPPVMLLYWGLSERLEWTRTWQILLGGTVVIGVAWAVSGHTGAVDIGLAAMANVTKGGAILLSVATVEVLATSDSGPTPGQLATGTGALALVFVVLVPTAAIGAGVVGDPEPEDGSVEAAFEAKEEPYPDYTELSQDYVGFADADDAVTLSANGTGDPSHVNTYYNVSETHIVPSAFEVQTYTVDRDGQQVPVKGHYYLEFDRPNTSTLHVDTIANSGTIYPQDADTDYEFDYYQNWNVPDSGDGTLKMEHVGAMWIYYDVVHENGEVHRYMTHIERTDV